MKAFSIAMATLIALTATATYAAPTPGVEADVTPTMIELGETVTLRIRLRDGARSRRPDFSALEHDFEIANVTRSERHVIENGHRDESLDWVVRLRPLHDGTISIPAIAVGNVHTAPREIVVQTPVPGSRLNASARPLSSQPIVVQMTTDRPHPYEQERVVVRVRLLVDAPVTEGVLDMPVVDGAAIEQLGEDRPFEKNLDGRVYRGVERTYAITPERPGTLEIPPITFEARVPDTRPRSRPRFGFGRGMIDDFFGDDPFGDDLFDRLLDGGSRRVAVSSDPLTLSVRPRPTESQGQWWLPARNLSLEETWSADPSHANAGESFTRHITVRAENASLAGLPPLTFPEVPGAKQYAEAAQSSEDATGSVREQDATFIPTETGELTIPAIEVRWWDIDADEPRLARLPARTIEVGEGVIPLAPSEAPALPASLMSPQATSSPSPSPESTPKAYFGALFVAGLAGVAGLAFAVWRRVRGTHSGNQSDSLRAARRALRRACRRDEPAAATAALRRMRAVDPGSLPRTPSLRAALDHLDSVQYSACSNPQKKWDGAAFWATYRDADRRQRRNLGREKHATRVPVNGLPPLYPGVDHAEPQSLHHADPRRGLVSRTDAG